VIYVLVRGHHQFPCFFRGIIMVYVFVKGHYVFVWRHHHELCFSKSTSL